MDSSILLRFQSGDGEALSRIVDEYAQSIFRFIFRIVHDSAMAEDCVQETFVKAWKNANRYDMSQSFKAWLFTIAHNTAIDMLRRKNAVPFSVMTIGEDTFSENSSTDELLPDELYDRALSRQTLEQVLRTLPLSQQEVLELHYREDMTFEEIGSVLDKPPNTVKSTHRRAILAIRQLLQQEHT